LRALRTLAGDRPVSLGFGCILTGRIPFRSLVEFADRYGIGDINAFDDFAAIVRQLDDFEVSYINDKANKKT
jgi:hypothetical protein